MNSVLFLVLAGILALLALGMTGCRREDGGKPVPPASVSVGSLQSLSRAEIDARLRDLESREAPKPKMGALCYDMAAPPERVDYVCPKCGEKTLYTKGEAAFAERDLLNCRRQFETIRKISPQSLILDESAFCEHCSPGVAKPGLALRIAYSDGTIHEASPIVPDDLYLLKGFLEGGLSYPTWNEGASPLKERLPRLRELLGIPESEQ